MAEHAQKTVKGGGGVKEGKGNCTLAFDQRDWDAGRKEAAEKTRGKNEWNWTGGEKSVKIDGSTTEGDGGVVKVRENTEVRCRRPERQRERERETEGAREGAQEKPWLNKLGTIKKNHSAWRNWGTQWKKRSQNKKEREEEMGTQTEQKRERGIENPFKGVRERMKKWQPHKGAWNSLLQGPCFLPSSILPFPSSPLNHFQTPSHLAWAVLNPGTLTLCQAWCNGRESCPAGACGCVLRVEKKPSTSSLDLPQHLALIQSENWGEDGGFKSCISLWGGTRQMPQLCAASPRNAHARVRRRILCRRSLSKEAGPIAFMFQLRKIRSEALRCGAEIDCQT